MDRYGMQSGTRNSPPTGPKDTTEQGLSSGDLLRACVKGASWEFGTDTRCPAPESAPDYLGKEFYWDDGGEEESAMGALALVNSMGKMVFTAADPKFSESAGVFKGDNVTGKRDMAGDYQTLDYTSGAGKGNGLGDLEALCDRAPIEIGNRVWFDANKNGVQDPTDAELPIAGVRLELLDETGKVIATATTDANGTYLFSGYPGSSTASAPHGLPLKPKTQYTVRIPDAVGAAQQAPLTGYKITKDHSTDDGGTPINDSDGQLADGTNDQVQLTTGEVGRNDHSFDFGFWVDAKVKLIKLDADTGNPLAGAKFTLKGPDGKVLGPFTSTETGYIIEDLAPGEYEVTETEAPSGYTLPNPATQKITLEAGKTGEVTFRDSVKPSRMKLIKLDEVTGKPVEGATFTVKGPDGKVRGPFTSTADGVIVSGLVAGEYEVTETAPPPGYTLPDPATQKVTVEVDKTAVVTFEDLPLGGMKLVKRDAETTRTLAGAKLLVKDGNGTVVGEYTSSTAGVTIPNLLPGTYTVTETAPPPGYELPVPATQTVTVKSGATLSVVFDDRRAAKPHMTVRKKVDQARAVPGAVLHYTIVARNTGRVPYTGARWRDDLSDVLTRATYNRDATATLGLVTYDAPVLRWKGDLPVGGKAVITYSVTVKKGAAGRLRNTVIWAKDKRRTVATIILKEKPTLR